MYGLVFSAKHILTDWKRLPIDVMSVDSVIYHLEID